MTTKEVLEITLERVVAERDELRAEVEQLKSDNKTLDFNLVETSKQLAAHKADAERLVSELSCFRDETQSSALAAHDALVKGKS